MNWSKCFVDLLILGFNITQRQKSPTWLNLYKSAICVNTFYSLFASRYSRKWEKSGLGAQMKDLAWTMFSKNRGWLSWQTFTSSRVTLWALFPSSVHKLDNWVGSNHCTVLPWFLTCRVELLMHSLEQSPRCCPSTSHSQSSAPG